MKDRECNGVLKASNSLVVEVERVMADRGWSAAAASRQIGITAGAFSAWRNGTYGADPAGIDVKVSAFLRRMREISVSAVPVERRFRVVAETSVHRQVSSVIRQCHLYGKIGLVTSVSGTGKTRAAEEYVAQNPGSILVKCHPNFPAGAVLGEIARQAGIEVRGSVHVVLSAIWEKLAGSGKVIILNEAEHLKPGVLDVVRSIWDEAQVGIVYIGIPRLAGLLRSLKGDYTYIWNRVSIKLEINRSKGDSLADLRELLTANGYEEEFAGILFDFCGGDIRLAEELFLTAFRQAVGSGEPLSEKVVGFVARELDLKQGGGR